MRRLVRLAETREIDLDDQIAASLCGASYGRQFVMSPRSALDPIVMLATGIHAQPGVYALLLGSGVSTGAGIPTGWGVVQALVRRAAGAQEPDNPEASGRAASDPEAWWAANGDGQPLGYSNLLSALAPTPSARRGLLAGFFEPTDEGAEAGLKVPGRAHRAIAQMAKRGLVRVIVTTNFDRLVERALEDAGVPPQVASRPDAARGLTPLAHAPITVVKLHGDYADLDMRNTIDELDSYPADWNDLLDRIFDEYGLLICGWSAIWDKALAGALKRARRRRYPLYWDARSSDGSAAIELLAQHSGVVVPVSSADELFTGLIARLDALDRIGQPPLTQALAIARLKHYLPDPVRRIDAHDLITDTVDQVLQKIEAQPLFLPELGIVAIAEVLARSRADAMLLLHLIITGTYHDRGREHTDLWVDALQRLLQVRGRVEGSVPFLDPLERARHYPALLVLRSAGIVAVHTARDDVLVRLLMEPKWRDPYEARTRLPALQVLHEYRILGSEVIGRMPRWGGNKLAYPESRLLRDELRDPLRDVIPDDDEYVWANDRYEYRVALAQHVAADGRGYHDVWPGEFILESKWDRDVGGPSTETDFRTVAEQADDGWPWWAIVGGRSGLNDVLLSLREDLGTMKRR